MFPRLFTERFAVNLKDKIKLWMADRNVWEMLICKKSKRIFGLNWLQSYYSVQAGYIYIFHYFGESTFYMTITDASGVDILNGLNDKLLMENVVMDNIPTFTTEFEMEEDYDEVNSNVSLENGESILNSISGRFLLYYWSFFSFNLNCVKY